MYNIRLTSISLTMVSNSYNTHVVHSIALNPDVSGHLLVPFAERYAYLVSELSDMAIQRVTITRNLEVKNSFHPYHVTQDTTKPGIVPILTVNPLQFKIEPARISIKLDGHKINSRKRKSLVKVTKTTGSLVVPEDTHEHLLVPLAVYYAELFERGGVDNIQRHKIHITRTLERDVDVKNTIHSNPYNKAIFELATNQVSGRKAQLSIPGVWSKVVPSTPYSQTYLSARDPSHPAVKAYIQAINEGITIEDTNIRLSLLPGMKIKYVKFA